MSRYGTLNRYLYRVQSWFEPGGEEFTPSFAFEKDNERIYDSLQLVKQRLRKHIELINEQKTPPHSPVHASILGQLNLIDHRLELVESKLDCVDEVKSLRIELEEIGESSTDFEDPPEDFEVRFIDLIIDLMPFKQCLILILTLYCVYWIVLCMNVLIYSWQVHVTLQADSNVLLRNWQLQKTSQGSSSLFICNQSAPFLWADEEKNVDTGVLLKITQKMVWLCNDILATHFTGVRNFAIPCNLREIPLQSFVIRLACKALSLLTWDTLKIHVELESQSCPGLERNSPSQNYYANHFTKLMKVKSESWLLTLLIAGYCFSIRKLSFCAHGTKAITYSYYNSDFEIDWHVLKF